MIDNALPPHADLDECEQEPLAFSGRIQDVGALLATRRGRSVVTHASDNLQRWFDLPDPVQDLDLNELFTDDCNYFIYRKKAVSANGHSLIANVLTNRGIEGDLLVSERGEHHFYEFEEKHTPPGTEETPTTPTVTQNTGALPAEIDVDAILRRIHGLTTYPKIMLYRFLPDSSGEVVAELSDNRLDNYQGLRFPASDIPRIARSLYIDNPFRLIFDTRSRTSPVVAMPSCETGTSPAELDLSSSTLRSVAEVHLEYLYNMKVRSSASFPVVVMGRLWGLMALHAVDATSIPMPERVELRKVIDHDLTRHLMDTQVREEHRRFNASVHQLREGAAFLRELREFGDESLPGKNTCAIPEALRALISCDALAIRINGHIVHADALVSAEEVGELCQIGDAQALRGQFSTSSMTSFLEQSEDFRQRVSGVLYSTTGKIGSKARLEVLWLRNEESRHVTWAGKPGKLRQEVDGEVRISPRQSFASWRETTQGEAQAWKSSDLMIAAKLLIQVISQGLPVDDS